MPAAHSTAPGDIVLAIAPPYLASPWMGVGIPLLHGVLEAAGLGARVVRLLDDPFDSPDEIVSQTMITLWGDPAMETRLAEMAVLSERYDAWFERLIERLTEGPERVFGFSTWRHNVNVTMELARRLKQRDPDCCVVLGGPEVLESFEELAADCIDVIAAGAVEGYVAELVRACVDGDLAGLTRHAKVWVHPRHAPQVHLTRHVAAVPPRPRIDYRTLLPIFVVDRWQSVPVLLNIGCPFRCGFCTNTSLYPETAWGEAEQLVDEIEAICETWMEHFPEPRPPLHIELCDATVNAQPAQVDSFLEVLAARSLPVRPSLHGNFVVDQRITPARVRALMAAGFESIFFGLESASVRVRRAMKKPGRIESVRRALEVIHEASDGKMRVNFNFIVGWPDETEEEFYESLRFVEWAAQLGNLTDVGIMPLVRTPAAMDEKLFTSKEGPQKGVAWVGEGPAGSPEVRCRRFMSVFERFHDLLPITSVLPREQVIRWMIPDLPEAVLQAWCAVHGKNDRDGARAARLLEPEPGAQRAVATSEPGSPSTTKTSEPDNTYAQELERSLERVVQAGFEVLPGWLVESFEGPPEQEVAIVVLENARDGRLAAFALTPPDPEASAFARLADFNVSYRARWRGQAMVVDMALVAAFVDKLRGAVASPGSRPMAADSPAAAE